MKNKILNTIIIVMLIGMLLILTGCAKDKNNINTISNDAKNETNEIKQSTDVESKEVKYTKKDESKELVYTSNEIKYSTESYNWSYFFIWPTINIESEDVDNINKEIEEDYKKYKTDYDEYGFIYDGDIQDYKYFVNDNILSLVILEEGNDTNYSMVYNVDLNTGKRLSNNELYEMKNIDKKEALDKCKASVKTLYDASIEKAKTAGIWEDIGKYYEEQFEKYIESQDYENCGLYLNEDGKLCMVSYYEELGGQEYCTQGVLINLEEDFKAENISIEMILDKQF